MGVESYMAGVEDTFYFRHGKFKVTSKGKFRKRFRRHAKRKGIGEKFLNDS